MNKLFSYSSSRQIWRILISDSDKLIIETRDLNTKEVFFNSYLLENGNEIFTNMQLEEKCWIGIESVYKDIIYFHHFPKPDMPQHKGIIAFDIPSQKVLWTNNDLSFHFAINDKVYCYKQGFEERYFSILDYLNGNILEELGADYKAVNNLRTQSDNEKKWEQYLYPLIYSGEDEDARIKKIIDDATNNLEVEGSIEYNLFSNLLFFNYNLKVSKGVFENRFAAVNLESNTTILSEILNSNAPSLFADSFFIYKKFLFLLKEKNEVIIYKLD